MKKKALKIAGAIVLLIVIGGLWGYTEYFKPNPEIQKQLKNQFKPDFFDMAVDEKKVIDLGKDNNSESSNNDLKSDTPVNINAPEEPKKLVSPKTAKSQAETSPNERQPDQPSPSSTKDEIIEKYRPQINSLQSLALSRLDTLYSAAIQEYEQSKKAGTLKPSELARKYIQAGNMLEGSVDSQLNSILNAMQTELGANNFPTDEVSIIKNEYENAKSEKRSQLLDKALK